jgi:hypothetical protein
MREGAPDRALVHFNKALEFAIRWAPTQPGTNSRSTLRGAYANAAGAQINTGDLKGALENYTLALQHAEQAIRQADSTVYERSVLSGAHKNLGDLLGHPADFNFGDRAGAIAQYRAALAIDEALSAADPEDVRARDDLANTYSDFAFILLEDRPVEAFQLSTRAANIAKELTSFAPGNTRYKQTLAFAEVARGETLLNLGRNRDAFDALTAALSAMKSVAAMLEDQIRAPCWITRIHRDLGATLLAQRNEREAEQHLREALAITEDLVGRAPTSFYVKRYRADAFEALGRYFMTVGRRPEDKKQARAYIERSLEMWRDWRRRNIATPYAGVRERNAAALLASVDKL